MDKHSGTIEDLKKIVESVGYRIVSCDNKGAGYHIKTEEGAIVNWYPGTKKLQYQGNASAATKLKASLSAYSTNGAPLPATAEPITVAAVTENKKVFVVHGHDEVAREQLELVLHKLGLDPFVLQNTSGGGLTIIEALEREIGPRPGAARFGIVLMTPDDVGYAKSAGEATAQPRPRQNVVLETGMLISALGRTNVAILIKDKLEVPSDAHGILYLSFHNHVKEAVPRLAERLRESGFIIQPARIASASS